MAINPLVPISKTLGVVKTTAGLTQKTLRGISTILSEKDKDRKIISSNIKILKQRRIQDNRRKTIQDAISAPTVVTAYKGPTILTQKSGNTSFTSRIMGFLGFLAAGWALRNLPTWISIGDQIIKRIGETRGVITEFGTSIQNFIFDIGGLFNAAFLNIKQFDFTDSSGRLRSSLDDLSGTIMTMGNQLEEALSILTQPFLDVPPLGSRSEKPSAYDKRPEPPTPSGPGGPGGSVGTKEQRAMLDAIAFAEGTRDQPKKGYNTMFTFKQFSGYEDHPRKINRGGGYSSDAAGRYQFLSTTWDRLARKLGLKDFSPENQDKAAIELAKEKGITQNILEKEGMSARVSRLLGTQWAAMSGSNLGQGTKSLSSIQKAYQISLGNQTTTLNPPVAKPQPTTPGKIPTAVIDEINVAGPRGGTSTVGRTGGRGEYLSRGGAHKGIDIGTSGQKGYYVSFAQSGKVTYAGWNDGGYGYLVIIRSGNLEFFFAHLAKILVKNGAPYNGETIGEIGNTGRSRGEHLHFEVRIDGGGAIDPEPYLKFLSIGRQFSTVAGKPPQPLTPLVGSDSTTVRVDNQELQIDSASIATFGKLLENLTTEQRGRKVVVIDDRTPTQPPMILSAGSDAIISSGADEFTLVNNFMKNKLLLDLTYL
jgi:murein DD-endopeptidase MepM/ murein hydrolase activator NlpD